RQNALDIAAGLEAEGGAAVVEQIELDIAAAPFRLFGAHRVVPSLAPMAAHDPGIDIEEAEADFAGEGEILVPIAAVVMVVEDAADAAMLAAMGQEEIFVRPCLVFGVP